MVSNDVDVVEYHPNESDAETAIADWESANSGATSLDHAVKVYEKCGRVGLAMIHTS